MKCERYQAWLGDEALGGLDVRRDAELAAHLEICSECRAALEGERLLVAAIDRGVARVAAAEPSPAMAVRIRQRVAGEAGSTEHAWRLGARRWLPVALVATMAVVLGSFGLIHRRNQSRSPAPNPLAQQQAPAIVQPTGASGTTTQKGIHAAVKPRSVPVRGNRVLLARTHSKGSQGHARRRILPAEPEVLVEKDEAALVIQLYNAARSGRVDGASLVAQPPGPKRDADGSLAPLEIPPLKTAELAEANTVEAGGNAEDDRALPTDPSKR